MQFYTQWSLPTFTVSEGFIRARSINQAGQVTGWFDFGMPSPSFAFLRASDGSVVEFEAPGATYTYPAAINTAGQVAGQYFGNDGVGHGFLRNGDGPFSSFDVVGSTYPMALDANGQTAGFYLDAAVYHGFLRGPDGTLGSNLRGQTRGFYTDSGSHYHGFLRNPDGNVTKFDVPNATESYPTAINSLSRITGWYSDASMKGGDAK